MSDAFINSSRGGHGASHFEMGESQRSSTSSAMYKEYPPKIYEELIQTLEGDVRKHIRIEQQLKLHIESIEFRLDELEAENEKLINSQKTLQAQKEHEEAENYKKVQDFDQMIDLLKEELKEGEKKYELQVKQLKEQFQQEKQGLVGQIKQLEMELHESKSASTTVVDQRVDGLGSNKSPSQGKSHFVRVQHQPLSIQEQDLLSMSGAKRKKDLSLEPTEKKGKRQNQVNLAIRQSGPNQSQQQCLCQCQHCSILHMQTQESSFSQMNNLSSTSGQYKQMKKSFLERPSGFGSTKQQDQSADLIKMQKEITKFLVAEKRASNKSKRGSSNYNNLQMQNLTTGTPDKQNKMKGFLNNMNISQSTQNQTRPKHNAQTNISIMPTQLDKIMATNCCCNSTGAVTSVQNKFGQMSYWTCQSEDNPYLQGVNQMHPNLLSKNAESNSQKNQVVEQSSNTSLNQGKNSMVVIQGKRSQKKVPGSYMPVQKQNHEYFQGIFDTQNEISFISGGNRQGTSNDGINLIGLGAGEMEAEEDSNDSILNSHRRSRSQNVNVGQKQSKSERKGIGRVIMMKNRFNNNSSQANEGVASRNLQHTYNSTKNGSSLNKESTPLKNLSGPNKAQGLVYNPQLSNLKGNVLLNSDERKKLYNTFMKEMNQSMYTANPFGNQTSTVKKKKTESQMRVVSTSSSRPRSQLGNSNNQMSQNSNYASMIQHNQQASLKYKIASQGAHSQSNNFKQSRNNPMNKIKDFYSSLNHNYQK